MTDTKQAVRALREAIAEYDRGQGQAPMLAKIGLALSCRRYLPPILDRLEELERLAESRGNAMRTYEARVREWTALAGSEKLRADTLQSQLENPWRPMSETPETGTRVLIEDWRGDFYVAFMREPDVWRVDCPDGSRAVVRPRRWMPLPPIPTKGGDNG